MTGLKHFTRFAADSLERGVAKRNNTIPRFAAGFPQGESQSATKAEGRAAEPDGTGGDGGLKAHGAGPPCRIGRGSDLKGSTARKGHKFEVGT